MPQVHISSYNWYVVFLSILKIKDIKLKKTTTQNNVYHWSTPSYKSKTFWNKNKDWINLASWKISPFDFFNFVLINVFNFIFT